MRIAIRSGPDPPMGAWEPPTPEDASPNEIACREGYNCPARERVPLTLLSFADPPSFSSFRL